MNNEQTGKTQKVAEPTSDDASKPGAEYTENPVELIRRMAANQQKSSADPNELLRMLYESYTSRFLADNEKIWTVGSIIIPVSLAGFAAFTTIQNPQVWHVVVLGFGSISMLFIWEKIADTHKKFQDKSMNWINAIEQVIKEQNPPSEEDKKRAEEEDKKQKLAAEEDKKRAEEAKKREVAEEGKFKQWVKKLTSKLRLSS